MPKFRKKPVVIDATQWYPGVKIEGVCGDDPKMICGCVLVGGDASRPHIHTLEGSMLVSPGDWIITGVQGERYPRKPDIFEQTYEKVEEE